MTRIPEMGRWNWWEDESDVEENAELDTADKAAHQHESQYKDSQ